ncbi:hypothetical protein K493DRAFT_370025 [Basidiobolus meristosporus CBS 931.73]|uniref:Uncharacterized protein n=1 Tax=Basidiobolus meristosporus CBS 931.73 TaxID=1314790 RepID=A0A1Y1YHN0_9FUNG|nr:hypothetical protein K493DRAFT_370025 [Basidiobolus meristosporus CBS 931.73]|eukprot:ORX97216.1 hypothetical protein K493DRAFT_370025 [Basidiobolus meristosporus CBS 931.73]
MSALTSQSDTVFKNNIQFMISSFALPIAISNTYHGIKMCRGRQPLIYKLNLLQATLLLINSCCMLLIMLELGWNCHTQFLLYNFTSFISIAAINAMLYLKAYSATYMIKAVAVLSKYGQVSRSTYGACQMSLPSAWMIGLVSSEAVIVLFLCGLFIRVIYTQWQVKRRGIYASLMKDGIYFSLSICASVLIITTLQLLGLIGAWELLLFGWIINSKLMTEQMKRSYAWREERRRIEQAVLDPDRMEDGRSGELGNEAVEIPAEVIIQPIKEDTLLENAGLVRCRDYGCKEMTQPAWTESSGLSDRADIQYCKASRWIGCHGWGINAAFIAVLSYLAAHLIVNISCFSVLATLIK